jgi:hypothetical protein
MASLVLFNVYVKSVVILLDYEKRLVFFTWQY